MHDIGGWHTYTHTLFWESSQIHRLLAANPLRMRSCDDAFAEGSHLHVGIGRESVCSGGKERVVFFSLTWTVFFLIRQTRFESASETRRPAVEKVNMVW